MSKPLKLHFDEVIIENPFGDAELIIKNATKDVVGFLFNLGDGVTEFRAIPDMTALDQDLIDIAALSAANDDIIQRKGGVWTNRTIAQYKADLALTKADVGLSLADNTADLDKPISTLTQAGLNLKANIASPTFTGIPAGPTAAPGTNTTQFATTAFVTAAVSAATTGVASFKGRTGTVVPATNDYTWAQIDKTTSSFADLATRSATDINSGTLADARLSSNVVLLAGTQTLTNKTINGLDNTITNIGLGSLAQGGATTGQVIKWNGSAWAPAADAIGGGITDGDYGDIVVTSTGALLSIKSLAVSTAKLAALAVTDAKINDVAWTKITGKPTTIAGYGITDGVTLTGSQTLTNKTLVSPVIANGGDLTGDTYYRNASGLFTRLGIGTDGQVLKVVAGLPAWAADATGGGGGGTLADGDYGDVSVTASGTAINVDSGAITNAKLAAVATNTIKGRITASAGAPEDLTVTQVTSMLNLFSSTLKGLVPLSGGGTANFLRADGTWAAPAVNYIFTASDFNESGSTISIDYANAQAASGSAKGFLTASDWTIFNSKQAALSFSGGLAESSGAVTIASSGVTTVKIADANVTDAKIVSLAWSKITGTPTTVAGYGITDAVTLTGTQTLTNKTLTSPKINVGSDATGDTYYRDASGNLVRLAIGSNGQVLKIASGLPAWGTDSTGGGGDTYTGTTNRISITGTVIDIASTYAGQSSLSILGTVATGVWNATAIAASKGGVPAGGTVGQILAKINGTDYNTQWIPAPSGASYFPGSGILIDGENNITVDDSYIISLVGSGVTDGSKVDIVVSSSGTVYTVANNAITTAKILDANVTNAKLANSAITHGAPGTTGTAPNWGASSTSLGGTATLNIPLASGTGVTAGLVSKTNYDAWQAKQDALISGVNVKTFNGGSILGSGNFSIVGLTDTNYGDWTISSSGTAATINANAVTTSKIADGNITLAKIQNLSASRILGRYTASTGVAQEIQIGTGLEVTSGGFLNSTIAGISSYYVDNSGLSTGSGSSEATAITMTRLITLSSSFTGGERIYFKAGGRYNGKITLKSGSYVSRYGTGTNPIISGAVPSTTYTWSQAGTIWSTTVASRVGRVLLNGVAQRTAQSTYYPVSSRPSSNQITSTSLVGLSNVTQMEIITKEYEFRFSHNTITAHNSGTGTITLDTNNGIQAAYGFKLFNHESLIAADGDWAWRSNTLYWRTPGNVNPNTLSADVSIHDEGLIFETGGTGFTVEGVEFYAQAKDGIYARNVNNVRIVNNNFHDQLNHAVAITGSNDGLVVQQNIVSDVAFSGISTYTVKNFDVSRNTITNIGTQADPPFTRDKTSRYDNLYAINAGINIGTYSSFGVANYNHLDNLAYIGIRVDGNDITVNKNKAYNYSTRQNDGAGIYTNGNNGDGSSIAYNINISSNIIGKGVGSNEGGWSGQNLCSGIYLDNYTTDTILTGNTAYDNGGFGIFVGGTTKNIDVRGNILYNNARAALAILNWPTFDAFAYQTINIKVENNTMTSLSGSQRGIYLYDFVSTNFNPADSGGYMRNNTFISPYTNNVLQRVVSGSTVTDMTLATAKATYTTENFGQQDAFTASYVNEATAKTAVPLMLNTSAGDATVIVPQDHRNPINKLFDPIVPSIGSTVFINTPFSGGGGGGSQNLQQVTDIGSSTDNPLTLTASGSGRDFRIKNADIVNNLAFMEISPSAGTNVGMYGLFIPKGTGFNADNQTGFDFYNTDYTADPTNYEVLSIGAKGARMVINSDANGTGTVRPLEIQTDGTARMLFTNSLTTITTPLKLTNLAGNGAGYAAIDNNGNITWSAGSGGGGGGGSQDLESVTDIGNATNNPIIFQGSDVSRHFSITNANLINNYAFATLAPSGGTNVGMSLLMMPRGTGFNTDVKTGIDLYNTDAQADGTNYEVFSMYAAGSKITLNSSKGGTGTVRPIHIQTAGSNRMIFSGSGGIQTPGFTTGYLQVDGSGNWSVGSGGGGGGSSEWTLTGSKLVPTTGTSVGIGGTPITGTDFHVNKTTDATAWITGGTGDGNYGQILIGEGTPTTGGYAAIERFSNATTGLTGELIMSNLNKGITLSTSYSSGYRKDLGINSSGIVRFNDAYSFPNSIGSPGQVLTVPGSGTGLIWSTVSGGGGGASWGSITGTLSSQSDLNTALGLKAPVSNPTFTTAITTPRIISSAGTPTATDGPNLNATVTVDGTDIAGRITVTVISATSTPTQEEYAIVTFAVPYATQPRVVFSPGNATAANLDVYLKNPTTNNFSIAKVSSGTSSVTVYIWDYIVIQ